MTPAELLVEIAACVEVTLAAEERQAKELNGVIRLVLQKLDSTD